MHVKVVYQHGLMDTPFSEIKEGEWFETNNGELGVKVDGKGFYPGRVFSFRGVGDMGYPVRRIHKLLIQEKCN